MKRILGLDLGVASIGWAIISEEIINGKLIRKILGMGSRIIPYQGTEGSDFAKGTGESRNANRTTCRTIRKGYDRYQLRRKYLINELLKNDMHPDEALKTLPKMQLWELRNKAITSPISLKELGRLLLWLNQKRGYKSSRSDANIDKKDTDYVVAVKSRHERIKELKLTIGQYFYQALLKDEFYRIKENIFPREAYIEEYDAICNQQKLHYPNVLTNELINRIRNEIIYYQRPLKSQKGLVSVCEFEGFWTKGVNGKEYFVGPKVAPKSSPLFQLSKMWENINNLKIGNRLGGNVEITLEQKWAIFNHLDNNEKLTQNDLIKILNLKKDECYFNKQIAKGIVGNITKNAIRKCISDFDKMECSHLNLNIITKDEECYLYDKETGELLLSKQVKTISPDIETAPFYRLWHTIYSINDHNECSRVLQTKYKLEKSIADKLSLIDFSKYGFSNKSVKIIRKTLPYLMEGDGYSDAMSYAGYNHSNSLTKDENLQRILLDKLKPIAKNSLRQPIVEKILNQMVNVVNATIEQYGKPDEIRVELARELKQSKEERSDTEKAMNKRQRESEAIAKRLEEFGLRATHKNIIKWRLFEEIDDQDKKLNAICIYCGQPISIVEAINGSEIEVEHIIPRSKLFDDSQSNKTLAHRRCNKDKNNLTAYDFMKSKPNNVLDEYVQRVNMLYNNKLIGKAKRDKLLMTETKIPKDFIDRQLRESQYIAKKSREILQTVCYNVWATSGNITAELRRLWGWDDVTMNLQIGKYRDVGLTEWVEWESEHGKNQHKKEVIAGWSKRDDHRHHAIDALIIACTKQGYIQRFNTLSANKTRMEMDSDVKKLSIPFNEKHSLLTKYIIGEQPFSVKEVEDKVANILISFKSGKRVATFGKRKVGTIGSRKVVQSRIIVPRGELSESSIYGRIKTIEKKQTKYILNNPHLIVDSYIRTLVEDRLIRYDGNADEAFSSLKKDPIYLNDKKDVILEYASCFEEKYVKKYDVDVNFTKIDKVIDPQIKSVLQKRLNKFGGKPKEAFRDIYKEGDTIKWYSDEGLVRPIHSVRCVTGLSAVVPVKKDELGRDIGFVKPGNNHHVAIYIDNEGGRHEHVCTFWHAVERKKYSCPVVITDSNKVWDKVTQMQENTFPESFLEQLPNVGWRLELSLQQNEMFIMGMTNEEIEFALENKDLKMISVNLYRVQKLSESYYMFRHHLETQLTDDANARISKRYLLIQSLNTLFEKNPCKVRIDCVGNIELEKKLQN